MQVSSNVFAKIIVWNGFGALSEGDDDDDDLSRESDEYRFYQKVNKGHINLMPVWWWTFVFENLSFQFCIHLSISRQPIVQLWTQE